MFETRKDMRRPKQPQNYQTLLLVRKKAFNFKSAHFYNFAVLLTIMTIISKTI